MHTTIHNVILTQAAEHLIAQTGSLSVLHKRIGYQDNELAHSRTIEAVETTFLPSSLHTIQKALSVFKKSSDRKYRGLGLSSRVVQYANLAKGHELQATVRVYDDHVRVTFSK